MLELDREELPSRVQASKAAVQTRIVDFRTSQPSEQNSTLEDALEVKGFKSVTVLFSRF